MSSSDKEPRSYREGRKSATAGAGMFASILKPDRVAFYDRSIVLSRIFANDSQSWVLKGGTALIWRDTTARGTRDIDLFNSETMDIKEALDSLRRALSTTFTAPEDVQMVIDDVEIQVGAPGSRQHAAVRIRLQSMAGMPLSMNLVKIDLVVGCRVTGRIDEQSADGLGKVLRAQVPAIRLYPIVDHLADKVAATMQTYPTADGESPSSRVRDLIDIAHIAMTETINGQQLRTAIESERIQRGLPRYERGLQCPVSWADLYGKRKGTKGAAPASFDEALTIAKRLIDPAISGEIPGATWADGTWV